MLRKKLLVLLIITLLIINITVASANETKNKKKDDETQETKENPSTNKDSNSEKNKTKEEKEDKTKNKENPSTEEISDNEKNENKEKEGKNNKDITETEIDTNNKQENKHEGNLFPYELHGPGKGKIKNDQEWSGEVWAHYDYNENFGIWEVGIEGLTEDGETAWYAFELVTNEVFKNYKLVTSGIFIDPPFNGLEFSYEANLNSMHWTIKGDGFHFSGTIVDYSFKEPTIPPLQGDYSSSVFWKNLKWNSLEETLRVTPEDYLESKIITGETVFWGEAYDNTPVEFYSASSQWIKVSFIDEGEGQPAAGVALKTSEDYLYVGGVIFTNGEETWQAPTYYIMYSRQNDLDNELVDTGFSREAGEHTIHLIRNEDGSLDCWLDWCYITSFSDFDSKMFSQICLQGNHDTSDQSVFFTDFEYSTGSPYMDMPTDVEFNGVFDTFYCDPHVKIVESLWSVIIREDGTASFSCTFTELNIEEDAPGDIVGGYDYFVTSMSGDYWIDRLDGIYVFDGVMSWEKNGKPLSTIDTTVYVHPDDYGNQLVVVWDPEGWMFGSILPH